MHLIIADYVCKELLVEERGQILLGAIAPDATQVKFDTHFKGPRFRFSDGTPWEYGRFIMKYKRRISEPFILGYLTHLVADEVWAMKSYFSGFKDRLKNDPALYDRYHQDFRLCNAKLNEMYAADELYDALASAVHVPKIEEVDENGVLELKKYALEDFHYPVEHVTQELDVFSFEEIVAYIERSAYRALDVCRPLLAIVDKSGEV